MQPGYVTEKPLDARAAGCIPLWWGDPSYRLDFNDGALINLYEYGFDIARVFDEVDFKEVAATPLLRRHPDVLNAELEEFLFRILTSPPGEMFLESSLATTHAPDSRAGTGTAERECLHAVEFPPLESIATATRAR